MTVVRSKKHMKFIRTLPCCMSFNNPPSDPAHISKGSGRGVAIKADDSRIVPLNHELHARQHNVGEISFYGDALDDAIILADELYRHSGNWKTCVGLVLNFRRKHAKR